MQAFKLVTFDATNTLLQFKVPPWEFYSIIARDYGFTGNHETLRQQMKKAFKYMNAKHPNFGKNSITWQSWWTAIVQQTFQGQLPTNSNVNFIANKLIDEFKTTKCWSIADGTVRILNNLREKDISIGIISNFDPRLHNILQNVTLYNSFDFILTSYEVGYCKPDKRLFEHARRACRGSVKPYQCLHVGDDLEKDYKGAREAGWHGLLVGQSNVMSASLPRNHVFLSIADLSKAIQENTIKF